MRYVHKRSNVQASEEVPDPLTTRLLKPTTPIAILITALQTSNTSWTLIPVGLAIGTDVFYFVVEEFLPDPSVRSSKETFIGLFIRSLLLSPCCFEGLRTCAEMWTCNFIYMESYMVILTALKTRVKSFSQFKRFHTKIKILHQTMEPFLFVHSYIWLAILFWILVVLACLAIMGDNKLPAIVMYLIYIMTVMIVMVQLIVVQATTKLAEMCVDVVNTHSDETLFQFILRKGSFETKIHRKEACATAPILWTYGPFMRITKEFGMVYFSSALNRIFDAILLLSF